MFRACCFCSPPTPPPFPANAGEKRQFLQAYSCRAKGNTTIAAQDRRWVALSSHRVCIFALFAQKLARVCLEHGEQPNKIRAKLFAAILKQRIRWDFLCPHQTAANNELATVKKKQWRSTFCAAVIDSPTQQAGEKLKWKGRTLRNTVTPCRDRRKRGMSSRSTQPLIVISRAAAVFRRWSACKQRFVRCCVR